MTPFKRKLKRLKKLFKIKSNSFVEILKEAKGKMETTPEKVIDTAEVFVKKPLSEVEKVKNDFQESFDSLKEIKVSVGENPEYKKVEEEVKPKVVTKKKSSVRSTKR